MIPVGLLGGPTTTVGARGPCSRKTCSVRAREGRGQSRWALQTYQVL